MRIALPLLVIGLLYGDSLWSRVPILSAIHPQVVLGVLVSWSLFELFASKKLLGQRVLQIIQLLFSPIVGAMLGITVILRFGDLEETATNTIPTHWLILVVGIVGGLLALVLQLVQAGWFYRLRGLPIWAILTQDFLCICLVLFAFDAPKQGGIIALLLLWLAIRSSTEWYRWYLQQAKAGERGNPRRYKQDPD